MLQGYAYDKTGNRTSATIGGTTTAYTYPATNHRLGQIGALATRVYDANGNTTSAPGTTTKNFVYGDHNRMTQAKNGTTIVMNYVYNGRGEQVRKYLGSANTYSLYDEAGHWLADYTNATTPTQQVIWFGDLPVGVIVGTGASQKLHYIEPDALGTPRVVVDPTRGATGTAVWTWDLQGEAFGTTAPNQNPDGDANQFVFNMRFPGQRYDSASGLNYNYFRDYEAATGRYSQSDPIGLWGGVSTYGYVRGRALVRIDPLGLWSFSAGGYIPSALFGPIGIGPTLVVAGEGLSIQSAGLRIGVGAGAGWGFDPFGTPPDPNACPGDNGIGVYFDAGISYGPIGAGIGWGYGGTQHPNPNGGSPTWSEYGGWAPTGGYRAGAQAQIGGGIEFTHYF